MPRYIDVDAFRMAYGMSERCEDCRSSQKECQYNDYSKRDFCGWLDDAPTVEAVPVRSTTAVIASSKDCNWYQCANCEAPIDHGDRYCRGCGAEVVWDDKQ